MQELAIYNSFVAVGTRLHVSAIPNLSDFNVEGLLATREYYSDPERLMNTDNITIRSSGTVGCDRFPRCSPLKNSCKIVVR